MKKLKTTIATAWLFYLTSSCVEPEPDIVHKEHAGTIVHIEYFPESYRTEDFTMVVFSTATFFVKGKFSGMLGEHGTVITYDTMEQFLCLQNAHKCALILEVEDNGLE